MYSMKEIAVKRNYMNVKILLETSEHNLYTQCEKETIAHYMEIFGASVVKCNSCKQFAGVMLGNARYLLNAVNNDEPEQVKNGLDALSKCIYKYSLSLHLLKKKGAE